MTEKSVTPQVLTSSKTSTPGFSTSGSDSEPLERTLQNRVVKEKPRKSIEHQTRRELMTLLTDSLQILPRGSNLGKSSSSSLGLLDSSTPRGVSLSGPKRDKLL